VAGERPARRRARGGDGIPATWPSARVAVAAAAVATTVALVLYPVLAAERLAGLAVLAGAVAALVLLAGIVLGAGSVVGAGLFLVGVDYAASLVTRSGTAGYGVVPYAGGLVLAAELAYWSLEAPREWALVRRRAVLVAALAGASSAVAALVVAVASASSGRSVAFELVAFGGAAAALLLLVRLATSSAARARSTCG
jgi:hypothetical protein